jgi:hypothetical protein
MRYRKFGLLLGLALIAVAVVGTASAASGGKASVVPVIADSQLNPSDTAIGGAQLLPTMRTIPHWWDETTDPNNGVAYGYNMVGADPNTCSGSDCDVSIPVDITPINVNITAYGQTWTFNGTDVVNATLDSPQFATNDYGTTSASTIPATPILDSDGNVIGYSGGIGAGGALSQDDAGQQLQLEDATMRAQFNKTGSSSYHVRLVPHVMPAVTFNVPQNQGTVLASRRGVIFGDVNISWWSSQISNLESKADPTHLPVYLTDSVMLFIQSPGNCCVIGYHGTKATGRRMGNGKSNGNTNMQTFAWASYVAPGIFNPNLDWALQDIHALSHEIAEWADDPFVNNLVEPWLTPTAPQYGCTNILETGDPVVAIGFSMGSNSFDQNNPWADGTYHPEDEVFLPWFMRTAPNTVSEPTQSPSTNVGRYTLMGDLNPYPGFREPATGC